MLATEKQLERALEGSIKKWKRILKGGIDRGYWDCPLCKLDNKSGGKCRNCAIKVRTGKAHCSGTPYIRWSVHHMDQHDVDDHMTIQCKTCRNLAKRELKFLISLQKKKPKKTGG